jgi:cytidylate kinase
LAALGDETARELSGLLGYRLVDKQTLDKTLESFGYDKKKMDRYDEKKPGLWASLSKDRDSYIHHLRSALFSEVEKGNVVIVGRGASAIFRGLPDLVSVRLISPTAIRLERVKSYFRCDQKRALHILSQSDSDRAASIVISSIWTGIVWKIIRLPLIWVICIHQLPLL